MNKYIDKKNISGGSAQNVSETIRQRKAIQLKDNRKPKTIQRKAETLSNEQVLQEKAILPDEHTPVQRTEKGEKVGGVVGGLGGLGLGAYVGAKMGGAIGTMLGPAGTVVGGLTGGMIGGIIGGIGGGWFGKTQGQKYGGKIGDKLTGPPKPDEITTESVKKDYFALYVLKHAFGKYFSISQDANVVRYTSRKQFEEAYKRIHPRKDIGEAVGFTERDKKRSRKTIHILTNEASYDATVHELVHHNCSPAWQAEFGNIGGDAINEGVTQYLTMYALKQFGLKPSGAYINHIGALETLNPGAIGEIQVVAPAYFDGNKDAMNHPIGEKKKSLIQMLNKLMFDEWDSKIQTMTMDDLKKKDL